MGPILQAVGIAPETLAVPGARVPFRKHCQLWEAVAEVVPDPSFGLDVVDRFVDAAAMGLLGLLAESAETLGDALDTVRKLNTLANEASLMRTWVEGDRAYVLDAHTRDGTAYPPAMAEAVMTYYAAMLRKTCPGHDVLVEVWFAHSSPPSVERYATTLGVPVRFSRPHNVLVLHAEALGIRMATARPSLHVHLERQAHSAIQALPIQDDILTRVKAAIRLDSELLGTASVERLARRLGVSRRTLQRRLAEAGSSVNALIDNERKERAGLLVKTTSLSLSDVASRVGFSDVRAFRRAFQRWFGRSPAQLRAPDSVADLQKP